MSDTSSDHPGLGQGTDISAADLDVEEPAPTPATSAADEMDDTELGTGDGADVQPGGAG